MKKNHGFTLIELLLYMGILSILLFIITNVFVSILDVQLESQATSGVIQDSQFIISRLGYDIKRTENITTPANPGDISNILNLSIDGINYIYQLNNGDLELNDEISTNKLNSFETNVSNLSFQRTGNATEGATIKLNFTLTSKTQRNNIYETKTIQTTLGLRKNE
ncbi:prepilin-type N-terminal cleavage/methylation domain-containing protein [Candidatus Gottesmanbacteria bacterium]|nr:prepilin-type N-terminal cleavage/methylation domain-containing protein [Candidatus Gottesmanbacteria bacterium]